MRGPYLDITWSTWGRKKKDCGGNGLCQFKAKVWNLFDEDAESFHTTVVYDPNDNPYVNVEVNSSTIFEDPSHFLYIDEDIISVYNGSTYRMSAGVYPINLNIGSLGGYTIPLDVY